MMKNKYFGKHLSLSEWATQANLSNKESMIQEDARKRGRLNLLNDLIGLPIVKSYSFAFGDINEPSSSFNSFLKIAAENLYALRVNPKEGGLSVLRNRKLKVKDLLKWLMSETIDYDKYEYTFELHIDPKMASIFIIEDNRIIGEFATGGILQLNKGIHDDIKSVFFEYDFKDWKFSVPSEAGKSFLVSTVELICLRGKDKLSLLKNEFIESLDVNFLKGYFEVISSDQSGIIFIDYNRVLKNNLKDIKLFKEYVDEGEYIIKGNVGCAGIVKGKAKVIQEEEVNTAIIKNDEILVCHYTSPDYLPLITASAGVVTDMGGILSHAAIVCRELGKTCIIGTIIGTQKIKTGDLIEVDAFKGYVKFIIK